jgi:murein DD-endopeptidase MepM/ murein hydrolase activator NlpD
MDRRHFSLLTALMVGLVLSGCDDYNGPVQVINLGRQSDSSTGAIMAGAHDNLWDIAKRYRLPIREIIDLNNLEPPYRLAEGQRLKLPAPVDYRARGGDTLQTIAGMFSVSESQLVAVNKIPAPYRIKPGQELRIPRQQQEQQVIAAAPQQEPVAKEELRAKQEPAYQSVVGKYAAMPEGKKPAVIAQQQIQEPVRLPLQGPSSFIWPVRGKVISGYGPKEDGLYNEGINIAAPRGTPVAAVADGVVAYVGNDLKSYGNLVLIRHGGGTMTAYAHLAVIQARKGMSIHKGQVIGTVGATGAVDTSQLHFEIRHGSKTCDPRPYLGAV